MLSIYLFLLEGLIYVLFNGINYIFINNYTGGEIHRILNRPGGADFGIIAQISIEYLIIISLLILLFLYLRRSTHWVIFATIGCSIFFIKLYEIIYVIKDKENYIYFVITIFCVATLIIFGVSALSNLLIQRPRTAYVGVSLKRTPTSHRPVCNLIT